MLNTYVLHASYTIHRQDVVNVLSHFRSWNILTINTRNKLHSERLSSSADNESSAGLVWMSGAGSSGHIFVWQRPGLTACRTVCCPAGRETEWMAHGWTSCISSVCSASTVGLRLQSCRDTVDWWRPLAVWGRHTVHRGSAAGVMSQLSRPRRPASPRLQCCCRAPRQMWSVVNDREDNYTHYTYYPFEKLPRHW